MSSENDFYDNSLESFIREQGQVAVQVRQILLVEVILMACSSSDLVFFSNCFFFCVYSFCCCLSCAAFCMCITHNLNRIDCVLVQPPPSYITSGAVIGSRTSFQPVPARNGSSDACVGRRKVAGPP